MIVDPTKDVNGTELVRLAQRFEFPEFVKQADLESTMRPRTTHYADPAQQRYPCETAAATWLSAAYFFDKQAELHPIQAEMILGQLQGYAKYHGILPEVNDLEKAAQSTKLAQQCLPESCYACVYTDPDGTRVKRLPITSTNQVKQAAVWLQTHGRALPYSLRNAASVRVLDKAASLGAALTSEETESLEKMAGRGVCDPDDVKRQMHLRISACQGEKHAAIRTGLLAMDEQIRVNTKAALNPLMLTKLAETIDDVDQALGLPAHYGQLLQAPEDFLFSATFTKAAAEVDDLCPLINGQVYSKSDLVKVPPEKLAELWGDKFVDACTHDDSRKLDPEKMATVLETLPRDYADTFVTLMDELRIKPALTKRGGFHPLNAADLQQLANHYRR
jgi:hypothetical protein